MGNTGTILNYSSSLNRKEKHGKETVNKMRQEKVRMWRSVRNAIEDYRERRQTAK